MQQYVGNIVWLDINDLHNITALLISENKVEINSDNIRRNLTKESKHAYREAHIAIFTYKGKRTIIKSRH